jgi:hypothetical protein
MGNNSFIDMVCPLCGGVIAWPISMVQYFLINKYRPVLCPHCHRSSDAIKYKLKNNVYISDKKTTEKNK